MMQAIFVISLKNLLSLIFTYKYRMYIIGDIRVYSYLAYVYFPHLCSKLLNSFYWRGPLVQIPVVIYFEKEKFMLVQSLFRWCFVPNLNIFVWNHEFV